MTKRINIRELYEKLDRELTEKSIIDLFEEKNNIIYNPSYQRNYVWDSTKAIRLIETILINGEVPPITIIKIDDTMEIIDGRQRIETIIKFMNNEFPLRQFGLDILKELDKLNYTNLPLNVRTIFDEYKIKIILYTIKPNEQIADEEIEYVKRNLFRKYNCGMTALTGREIARAKYLYDPLTIYISDKLESDKLLLDDCIDVLLPKNKRKDNNREKINDILVNIREMLSMNYIPIVNVNTVKVGIKIIDLYYKKFIADCNVKEKSEEFFTIFEKLVYLKKRMKNDNYVLADNMLFIKSVYWMLSLVYVQYTKDFYNFDMDKFYNYIRNEGNAAEYFSNNQNIKSNHIINRYRYVKKYLDLYVSKETIEKINNYLDDILINKRRIIYKAPKISRDEIWYGISANEKLKTHISKYTIEEIIKYIRNNRFVIRDVYQRNEVKNKVKASRIIESILLGIKIPPIYLFVETGEDYLDRYTVIDGQQRLISILSYIGEVILDGKEGIINTYKNKYRLTGLKDLDLNGYVYDDEGQKINDSLLKKFRLNENQKNRILKYEIEAITIDKKANPNFNAVDMFLRMNQNPCNISENTFEMWNSYDIIDTIKYIKEIAKYDLFKQYGNKMKEEELVIVLAYMDHINININNVRDFLRIYLFTENKDKANERIEVKLSINNKYAITNYLENLEPNSSDEQQFRKSLDSVNDFIYKLKCLTDDDVSKLIKIYNPYIEVPRKGNMKDFYITWLILNEFDIHIVKTYKEEIMNDLNKLFKIMKHMPPSKTEEYFLDNIKKTIEKYKKIKE